MTWKETGVENARNSDYQQDGGNNSGGFKPQQIRNCSKASCISSFISLSVSQDAGSPSVLQQNNYQLGTDPYSNLYLPMRNYLDLTAATNCGKVRHIFMKKMQSYFQKPNKR
uniref:Uncharacterized protein n=1 Tax=Timema genevievae TaxID=629358 RepID=A0A7R9K4Q6_TIMGE|nr:unnamed protein product [Timema genevievae]